MLTAINPQAFVVVWFVVFLVAVVLSLVLLYHWWRYLSNRKFLAGLITFYFVGLSVFLSVSVFALYGVIK